MKKVSILIAFLWATYMLPSIAQTRYYRHEVNVSLTRMYLPKDQWDDYVDNVYEILLLEHQDGGYMMLPLPNGTSSNGTLFSYYYHMNQHIALGAITAFTSHSSSLSGGYQIGSTSSKILGGRIRENSFFFMPSLKWLCLNSSWCSIYTKASIGLHYERFRTDVDIFMAEFNGDLNKKKYWFAYLVTPFGWEVGKQKVRGFVELGFGSNFNLQIGLTYRFGRFEP